MTKKDYILASKFVKEYEKNGNFSTKGQKKVLMHFLADLFQNDNPRFKRDVFFSACEDKDES